MIKKLLLTTILGVAGMSAFAATQSFQFSYAYEPCTLNATGPNAAEEISVAMGFYNPAYAGMKITHIDCYINADASSFNNFNNTKVFMTKELNDNDPDIVTIPASLESAVYSNDNVSKLSVDLPTPYEITSEPVYVGYTLNVMRVLGAAEQHPILLCRNVQYEPAFFYRSKTSTGGAWSTDYYTMGAAIIVITIEREVTDWGIGINEASAAFSEVGKDFSVNLNVSNLGLNPISEITYNYALEGGETTTDTYKFETPLDTDPTKTFNITLPLKAIDDMGSYVIDLDISAVDGHEVTNETASTFFEVDVLPYLPTHRPLVEEFTNLFCGWCPRGYAAMEYIGEVYGEDAVVICYHNDMQGIDPMSVTNAMPMTSTGNPAACIDRQAIIDPYYGSTNKNLGIIDNLEAAAANLALASIDVTATFEGDEIVATSTTTFVKDLKGLNYRVGYVISCNGMTNPTEWAQTNYFARDPNYKDAPLIDEFYSLPSKVYGLVYNDVAVNVSQYMGISGSIPSSVTALEPIENVARFNIANIRNTSGQSINEFIERQNLVVNAFIVDRSSGRIINANKFSLFEAGVDAVEVDAQEVVSTVYYDLTGARVANPQGGIFIRSEKMADGTVRTSKVVVK